MSIDVYEGEPQTPHDLLKLCIYSYVFKLQLLEKYFPLMQCTYRDVNFDVFQCFCWFLFHLLHIGKMFPFEDIFSFGETKEDSWGKIRWTRRVGHGGHAIFGQKLLNNTQHSVGRCACKLPITKWANVLKDSSKKIQ